MLQVPALKQTPMIAGDGTQTSAFATTIGAYKSDGSNGGPVFTSVASVHLSGSAADKFTSDYDAAFGANNISAYSAGSYDCTMVLIQAAKAALASGAKPPANSGDLLGQRHSGRPWSMPSSISAMMGSQVISALMPMVIRLLASSRSIR